MKKGAVWLLLGVIIGGVYANALGNGFVFDDYLIVLANPALPRVAENPWLAFSLQTLGYRPFRTLSYVLDFAVGGMNPWLFHFNNIVYHWLTACLVFLVAQRLVAHAEDDSRQLSSPPSPDLGLQPPNSGLWVALCTALLWAIHPIQTDVVAYISGRRDILATLFFFLGFYAFLVVRAEGQTMRKSQQIGWFLLLGFSYGLGMLSKEMAVTCGH